MKINEIIKYQLNLEKTQSKFNTVGIKQYVPIPTSADYKIGYIIRYFVQRANDINSPIFEVNNNNFTIVTANPLYMGVSMKWKITGIDDEIRNANSASIRFASNTMKNIGLYIPYLLQFKK